MVQIHQDVDIAIVNDFIAYITSKIKVYFSFSSILESKVSVFLMFMNFRIKSIFISYVLSFMGIPNLNYNLKVSLVSQIMCGRTALTLKTLNICRIKKKKKKRPQEY